MIQVSEQLTYFLMKSQNGQYVGKMNSFNVNLTLEPNIEMKYVVCYELFYTLFSIYRGHGRKC